MSSGFFFSISKVQTKLVRSVSIHFFFFFDNIPLSLLNESQNFKIENKSKNFNHKLKSKYYDIKTNSKFEIRDIQNTKPGKKKK